MSFPAISSVENFSTQKNPLYQSIVPSTKAKSDNGHAYHVDAISSGYVGKLTEIETIRHALHLAHNKPTLWEILDKGRLVRHRQVVENTFLKSLVNGTFCETAFMKYLINFLEIHEALEQAQQQLLKMPHLRGFVMPELFRSERIKTDLLIWNFVADSKFVPWKPCEEAKAFGDYIRKTSESNPERLIGIMYALYGTIMSGGQTNKKAVQAKLEKIKEYTDNVPKGSGVALYEIVKKNILTDQEMAEFKREWHMHLCEIETLRPPCEDGLEIFHQNLLSEVNNTFETILLIIQKDVQESVC